ncbi:MAG: hypothetical protein Q7R67_02660 [bacterium]|nr:hypothetical protein [bacterium]
MSKIIKQEQSKRKNIKGNSPRGIKLPKKIGLTPEEKKAIFFSLKKRIDEFKESFNSELKS